MNTEIKLYEDHVLVRVVTVGKRDPMLISLLEDIFARYEILDKVDVKVLAHVEVEEIPLYVEWESSHIYKVKRHKGDISVFDVLKDTVRILRLYGFNPLLEPEHY